MNETVRHELSARFASKNYIEWKVDEMLKASYGLMGCAINVRRIDRSGLDLSM